METEEEGGGFDGDRQEGGVGEGRGEDEGGKTMIEM